MAVVKGCGINTCGFIIFVVKIGNSAFRGGDKNHLSVHGE